MNDAENFKWAMRLLDAVLDGIIYPEDLSKITGLNILACDAILADYYKLSGIRNAM